MNEVQPPFCWGDLIENRGRFESPGAEEQKFLDHVDDCASCGVAMEAVVGREELLHRLDADRAVKIRERLLERARNDRKIESSRPRLGLPEGSGWAVAAGLATLLLSHHAFHQPLDYGWLAAAFLAVLALGLGLQILKMRRTIGMLELRVVKKNLQRESSEGSRSGRR